MRENICYYESIYFDEFDLLYYIAEAKIEIAVWADHYWKDLPVFLNFTKRYDTMFWNKRY